jgi:DNA polymerase-1
MLKSKVPSCVKCPYYEHEFVPSEGSLQADVVFIGDSPWKSEVIKNRPLIGPAGDVYNALLDEVGLERRDVFTTNVVHCRPDTLGEAYPPGVVELCTELFLKRELERIKPQLLVPMGNSAIKGLGIKENISRIRGLLKEHTFKDTTYPVIPTFHPSFILRQPAYLPYSAQDFESIKHFLDHGRMKPENTNLDYRAVITSPELRRFFEEFEQAKFIAWDTETTGLDYRTDEILSMSFSFTPHTGYCLPFYRLPYADHKGETQYPTFTEPTINKLLNLLQDKRKIFLFHNGKFDLRMMHYFFLRHFGATFNIDNIRWFDTMAMYGLLNENTSQSLKEISKIHTDLRYSSEELATVKGGQMKKATLEDMTNYSVKDTDATRRIGLKFAKELKEQGLWNIYCRHIASDMKVGNILFKMEVFGAPIELTEIKKLEHFMQVKLTHYHKLMQQIVGREFNPNSSVQLCKVLYEELKFPIPEKKTAKGGKPSTDEEVINGLIDQYPKNKFLKYFHMHRKYTSIEKTFVRGFEKKLDKDGRLHPDFGYTRTVSGRVVCYKPNLANIPRDREFEEGVFVSIRNLFAAAPGKKIVYADAAQIEFKTAAILSGDKKLIHDLFVDRADFHDLVARGLFPKYEQTLIKLHDAEEKLKNKISSKRLREKLEDTVQSCLIILKVGRTRAKNVNFGRIYGAQSQTLADALGTTVENIEVFFKRLAKRYPRFEDFLKDIPLQAIREGELTNPFGRMRRFPPTPDERVEQEQARQGGNFLPQSSAAYVIRGALVRIATTFERVGMASYPFNIVYDSIIVESPDDEVQDAAEIMIRELLAPVPELDNHSFAIECGVGQSWHDAEKNAKKIYTMEDYKTLALTT